MVNEKGDQEESGLSENIKALGQMVAGELEIVGGILTADPISQAEGEYNVEAGTLHRESVEALAEAEKSDESDEKSNQTE